MRFLSLSWILILLTACASYPHRMSKSLNSLERGNYQEALDAIKKDATTPGNDQIAFLLDYALMLQIAGKYEESNEMFHLADQLTEVKDYHSLSKIGASILLNEGQVQYKGEDFEKVLINVFSALNYSVLSDNESALVEVRRINEKLDKYRLDAKRNYKKNAFAYYLSAIVWESDKRYDDAYIDYKRAYDLDTNLKFIIKDLLRLSFLSKRWDEYQKWKKLNNNLDYKPSKLKAEGELVVFYQSGKGPIKRPHPNWPRIPKLFPRFSRAKRLKLNIGEDSRSYFSNPIFNITEEAIANLEDQYAALIAKRVAARVVKRQLADKIGEDNEALGLAALIVMDISDQADLRQWISLPESLHILRLRLKEGKYSLNLSAVDEFNNETGESKILEVEIKKSKTSFVNWRSFY